MMVGYTSGVQCFSERRLIELWVAARAWERSDVGERFDSMGAQQSDEGLNRMIRMSDRKDRSRLWIHFFCVADMQNMDRQVIEIWYASLL